VARGETTLAETATEAFGRLTAVNARAPFVLCRQAIPYLVKSPRATIINICSVVSHRGYPRQGAYAAGKDALRALTSFGNTGCTCSPSSGS